MSYLVLYYSEDGDRPRIETLREDVLVSRLAESYYGPSPRFLAPDERMDPDSFVGLVVIRGSVVVPQPAEVIKTWRLS